MRDLPESSAVAVVIKIDDYLDTMRAVLDEFIVEKEYENLKAIMLRAVRFLLLTIIPFCVWLAIMSGPLSEFLFSRGRFSVEATAMVRLVLFFLVPTIFFQSMNSVFRQVLLSMKRIRFILAEGTCILIMNILLSVILMQYMDVAGLAVGTSVSSAFDCVTLIYYFRKETGPFPKSGTTFLLGKVLIASTIVGVALGFFSAYFGEAFSTKQDMNQVVYLASSAFGGALLYLGLAWLFRIVRLKDPLGWSG